MKSVTLSIIIATFNSAHLLTRVLESIHAQTYPKNEIEILIIDGGSTDKTLLIAKKFGCKILKNKNVVPAWAKYIGYQKAKGKYIMYLDSDEVILHKDSLKSKLTLLQTRNNIRAVTGSGYVNPSGYSIVNRYINEFGDPFSFFIYRLSKDDRFFIPSMKSRYQMVEETHDYVVFDFTHAVKLPIFELVAMGSIVDNSYMHRQFPHIDTTPGLIPHIFYLLVAKGAKVGIVKNDPILHFSAITAAKYLKKIRSRVINNIFSSAQEGFNGRDDIGRNTWYLKYLFFPYTISIIFPVIDALILVMTRKHIGYLIHIPLTMYTMLVILYYTSMRAVGMRYNTNSYG